MGVSKAYRERVMEQMAPVGTIRARNMFGEIGLYADDKLFGMMVDDAVYFKVDDTNRAAYEAEGSALSSRPGQASLHRTMLYPKLCSPTLCAWAHG